MRLLAFDTSTDACSVAVWADGTLWERHELAPRRHAALILPMIEAVLAVAGLTISQLDAVAFGCGPGAFTGVRVAAGIAQGLAFAADLPVAPISSLAAMALGAGRETGHAQLAVALDARMGEVYWGAYAMVGAAVELRGEECVCAPAAVSAPPGNWFGVGSGWGVYPAILARRVTVNGWSSECLPHAGDIARLAADPRRRAEWLPAERALPVYLRNEVVSKPVGTLSGPAGKDKIVGG